MRRHNDIDAHCDQYEDPNVMTVISATRRMRRIRWISVVSQGLIAAETPGGDHD
jgi:hypothetical protein